MIPIMPSHRSKRIRTSLHISTTPTHVSPGSSAQAHQVDDGVHDRKPKQKVNRKTCTSPIMLSDPLESPSSDEKSFDEDDMYGSDSGVETISLKPFLRGPVTETNEPLVRPHPL